MTQSLNHDSTNGNFEGEEKPLAPLGIKSPLLPAKILGQNGRQMLPRGMASSYLGAASSRNISSMGDISEIAGENGAKSLTFEPISEASAGKKSKPATTPAAWSSITDLLDVDHPTPVNSHSSSQPVTKTVVTPPPRTETVTLPAAQKSDQRNLEMLSQAVYALIQQQLLREGELHSQSRAGKLPW